MVIVLPRKGEHYPHYPESSTLPSREGKAPLSEAHRRMLEEESGINANIIAERGYFTPPTTSEIPKVFRGSLRRKGLVIPMFSPDGVTELPQLRANKPWRGRKGKTLRYMTPKDATTIIDVHPRNKEAVTDSSVDLWITEGVKKGDSMTTHGLCAISLAGVWNFSVRGTHSEQLKGCWDHVALQGRAVYVVYDSDVMVQQNVQQALERLVTALEGRGASVQVVYLPDAPDGSKNGVDDYLVGGGTVEELYGMARPFEPSDYTRERLSRDDELRATTEALWAEWRSHKWKGTGGDSRRAVQRALIEEFERSGEVESEGPSVKLSRLQAKERTGLSKKAVDKAFVGLEEKEGMLKHKTRKGLPIDEPSSYTLLVDTVSRGTHHGNDSYPTGDSYASSSCEGTLPFPDHVTLHSGYPLTRNDGTETSQYAALQELKRLRWGYTMRMRTDEGYDYQYVERIGKKKGEAFEILLLEFGGDAHAKTISKAMGRNESPSRFIDRIGRPLEAVGLVRIEGQRLIALPEWVANLGLAREMGGEYVAERLTKERHERQREGFQLALRRGKRQPQPEAPPERADGYIEDLQRVEEVPVEVEEVAVEEEHEHDLGCDCIDCAIPAPRYAVPYGMRAA